MQVPDDVTVDVRRRLRRVSGQIDGIERMLGQGRECRDVLTQLAAARRALDQASFQLVAAGLAYCLEHPEDAETDGYGIDDVRKMFMKLM